MKKLSNVVIGIALFSAGVVVALVGVKKEPVSHPIGANQIRIPESSVDEIAQEVAVVETSVPQDISNPYLITKEQLQADYNKRVEEASINGDQYYEIQEMTQKAYNQYIQSEGQKTIQGYMNDPDSYFMPPEDMHQMSMSEVLDDSEELLSLKRNEYYAIHGYQFKDEQLNQIFNKKSWYHPIKGDVSQLLSEDEKANIEMLISYEEYVKKHGYNKERVLGEHKMAYSDYYKVPVGETITMDLNGDGKPEQITSKGTQAQDWGMTNKVYNQIEFSVGDQTLSLESAEWDSFLYIVDIDKDDNYKEIVVYDYGPSNDPVDYYYYYNGNKIEFMGSVQGHINENNDIEDGVLHAKIRNDILDTHYYDLDYHLDDNHHLVAEPRAYYEVNIPMRTVESMILYTEPGSGDVCNDIQKNEMLTAYKVDFNDYVYVTLENGKKGWIDGETIMSGTDGLFRAD